MDDGPLDRLHRIVPPLEVTATAGVCVGLFAFGRMIFRAPLALTVLGGLGLLAIGAFHDGMSLYELWGLACGFVILVTVIFMVGFFCTGQPLLGLLLLGFLILFEKVLPKQSPDILVRMIQSDNVNVVAAVDPAASTSWGWLWLVGILAAVIGIVIYACVCDRKQRNGSPLF